jgi:hypothetical protein
MRDRLITHGKFGGKGRMVIKPFEIPANERVIWMKFLLNNIRVTSNGCWEWKGRIHRHKTHEHRANYKGYPCGNAKGKSTRWMHRVAYALYHGLIPADMHVDHKCQNTICVCPRHLEAVTPLENYNRIGIRKRLAKKRQLELNGQQRLPF